MSSNSIWDHKLHSHVVYLTLAQPSLVHENWQHLHHGLFDGFHHQMHPVAWNRNPSVATAKFPPLPHPPHKQRKMEKDERRTRHFEWQTQWPAAFICAAQLRSSVCSDTTPSRLPLLPFSLPPVLVWDSQRDQFLPRGTFCSLQPSKASGAHICLNHFTVQCFPVSTDTFLKQLTNQSRTNPKDAVPVLSSGFNSLHLPGLTRLLTEFMCTFVGGGLCSHPVSQGDVRVRVHQKEPLTSHPPRQFCPGLTNASTAAGMGSENWPSPKICKSYYTRA